METLDEEHMFILTATKDKCVEHICAEFGLVPYRRYIAECEAAQAHALEVGMGRKGVHEGRGLWNS